MTRLVIAASSTNVASDLIGAGMRRRLDKLREAEEAALKAAAMTATSRSQSAWNNRPDKRAPVARRSKRLSSGGHMGKVMRWQVASRAASSGADVQINLGELNRRTPQWLIQEMGTGKRAVLRRGGKPHRRGRPSKDAKFVKTVPSQRGRRLPAGLVWATQGGRYAVSGTSRHQQIQLASQVTGKPGGPLPGIRISREIKGQHFVQRGGEAGFSQYQKTFLGAARRTFDRNYQP